MKSKNNKIYQAGEKWLIEYGPYYRWAKKRIPPVTKFDDSIIHAYEYAIYQLTGISNKYDAYDYLVDVKKYRI